MARSEYLRSWTRSFVHPVEILKKLVPSTRRELKDTELKVQLLEEAKDLVLDRGIDKHSESGCISGTVKDYAIDLKGELKNPAHVFQGEIDFSKPASPPARQRSNYFLRRRSDKTMLSILYTFGFRAVNKIYGKDPWRVKGSLDGEVLTPEHASYLWRRYYPVLRLQDIEKRVERDRRRRLEERNEKAQAERKAKEAGRATAEKVAKILENPSKPYSESS